MRKFLIRGAVVLVTVLGLPLLQLQAQQRLEPSLSPVPVSVKVAQVVATTAPAETVYVRVRREPAGAGVLSYLFPGMGSFYAGHTRHGVTHMALTFILVGVSMSESPSGEWDDDTQRTLFTAYVVNWGWSIVTAVRDARANNRWVQRAP
ncbi:MAG: hypothetical protein U0163_16550 [Gemmatimonadaceae bacterium]